MSQVLAHPWVSRCLDVRIFLYPKVYQSLDLHGQFFSYLEVVYDSYTFNVFLLTVNLSLMYGVCIVCISGAYIVIITTSRKLATFVFGLNAWPALRAGNPSAVFPARCIYRADQSHALMTRTDNQTVLLL